jgi:TonB family protein
VSSAAAMPVQESEGARRRYARYHLSVPFELAVFRPSTVMCLSGQAEEVGEGGLRGLLSGAVLPGERVELSIVLPGSPEPLNMRAVVRHHAGLLCGLEFLSLEQTQREQLQQLGADPGLRSRLINETECEPGLAPPPREVPVCASCGDELAEEIPVCLTCGTPQSADSRDWAEAEGGERETTAPAETGVAKPLPAAKKEDKTRRRAPALDSVIAIIFLITLAIGLWQWMESPADADSTSQPSPVTVELENVFLRPASSAASQQSSLGSSAPNAALTAAKSAVSAFIGDVSLPRGKPAADTSSRGAAASTQRREAAVSNSAQNSAAGPALPAPVTPTLPAPAAAAAANPASSLTAESSRAASALAGEAPRSSELAGMLLQKVLPVYPDQARRQGVQGQVVLKAVIGKDGTIAELRPLQGPEELTSAAIDAVQHWRFRPYELKGKPVEVETDIRLNFQLPNKK